MTTFIDKLNEANLGYAAIFVCIGMGFLFLRRIDRSTIGPGYWSLGFFLNGIGFVFWSGVFSMSPLMYRLIGEIFHISGFFAMVCGAYRFVGNSYKRWNLWGAFAWFVIWLAGILALQTHPVFGGIVLKAVRGVLFIWAGWMILRNKPDQALAGNRLTGISLLLWGVYAILFAFWQVKILLSFLFGLQVGFQILAAFGMVGMLVDRIRLRAEAGERTIQRLEGLLPICSYCKKIRDNNGRWHQMEAYIEDRSPTEFSHGICPDCAHRHFPESQE